MSKKQKSPIDILFHELFGYYPNKSGQAYEIISAAAIKIITDKDVKFDQFVKGEYSNTTYQLDGEIISSDEKEMLEAKDYTIDNRKVGRGDLQKLSGALSDLKIDKGLFASATDFTKPAEKYAKSTSENPLQKPIELFHIRESTELDEKGRIRKITFNAQIAIPNFDKGSYSFEWTEEAIKKFTDNNCIGKEIKIGLSEFYDKNGNIIITLSDYTRQNQPKYDNFEDESVTGFWDLSGYYIKFENELYPIKRINYEIPYDRATESFDVEREGNSKILIKSADGKINKLLTDKQFKKLTFKNKEIK